MRKELFLLGIVFLITFSLAGENAECNSRWDKGLPQLKLQNVHIQASSLKEAWQNISDRFGIRTIIFVRWQQPASENTKFKFDSDKCAVSEVLMAFEKAYSDYTQMQDDKTGIIWLHPQAIPYDTILTNRIRVGKDADALPMQTGILEMFRPLKIWSGGSDGPVALNTFNNPVNLHAGSYCVRDILNVCCLANPNRTFFVTQAHNGVWVIYPLTVILFHGENHQLTPALLSYWQSEIDSTAQDLPTDNQLINALSSNDLQIRSAARNYVELDISELFSKLGGLLSKSDTLEKSMWVAIANLNVVACTDPEGPILHLPEMDKMEKALKEEDWSGNTGLKALVAMEVARVTRDTTFLEQVAKQPLSVSAIANVKPDIIRTLRVSSYLRDKLLELGPQWAGFSKAEIQALGQTNIFSLP